MRIAAACAFALIACSGDRAAPRSAQPAAAPPPDAAPVDAAPAVDATPPIDEAHARALLAERFRAAGLRIRYDVVVAGPGFELAADGYDPERRIGFEYVAPDEVDTDLSSAERAAVARASEQRLLIVGPAGADAIARAADSFLAALAPDAGQP